MTPRIEAERRWPGRSWSPLQDGLGLDDEGNGSILIVEHVGLKDDRATPGVQRLGHGPYETGANATEEVRLGLDRRRCGPIRQVQVDADTAPAVSASAMMAPPWRMPSVVHRSGDQPRVATTVLGPARSRLMPSVSLKGMRPRSSRSRYEGRLGIVDLLPPERSTMKGYAARASHGRLVSA